MKCSDARRKLSAVVDTADDASLRDAVARHVDACGACRAELDALVMTDRLVVSGMQAASAAAAPAQYFEDFWPRLSARLDVERREVDAMSMSTSSEDSPKERSVPAGTGERNEVSGLHDIRALAQNTITRHNEKLAQDIGEVADALLASTSPAALGQVVLPVPGKEVSGAHVVAAATRAVEPQVAAAAAQKAPASWARTLVMAAAVLVAGGAVAFVMYKKNETKTVATAPAVQLDRAAAAAPVEPSAAAVPADTQPGGAAPATPPAEPTPAEPTIVAMVEAPKPAVDAKTADKATADPRAKDAKMAEAPKDAAKPREVAAVTPVETKPADPKPAEPKTEEKAPDAIEALLGEKPKDEGATTTKTEESLPSSLEDGEVKKGMGAIKARVQDCYARYKVPGMVKVKTVISPDGTVSSAVAVDDKFANTETGQCVADAVSLAKFKKWSGDARTVTYPFVLK